MKTDSRLRGNDSREGRIPDWIGDDAFLLPARAGMTYNLLDDHFERSSAAQEAVAKNIEDAS
jgi:hypothetical protein